MCRSLIGLMTSIFILTAVARGQEWLVQEQLDAFSLLADYPVNALEIQARLIELSSELDETLGVRPTGEPIQIVLFESRKNYLAYLGAHVPASRHRRAVYIRKGTLTSIYCYRSEATMTDVRHEMTHALLHQHLQFLPLWMDEGLAEYFEELPSLRATSSRAKSIRWKAAMGWSPDLERLERIRNESHMNSTDYRDSWAMCSYLLNESPGSRTLLSDYLREIHDGQAPPQFSDRLKAVENDWQGRSAVYFRKPVFRTAAQISDLREPSVRDH